MMWFNSKSEQMTLQNSFLIQFVLNVSMIPSVVVWVACTLLMEQFNILGDVLFYVF